MPGKKRKAVQDEVTDEGANPGSERHTSPRLRNVPKRSYRDLTDLEIETDCGLTSEEPKKKKYIRTRNSRSGESDEEYDPNDEEEVSMMEDDEHDDQQEASDESESESECDDDGEASDSEDDSGCESEGSGDLGESSDEDEVSVLKASASPRNKRKSTPRRALRWRPGDEMVDKMQAYLNPLRKRHFFGRAIKANISRKRAIDAEHEIKVKDEDPLTDVIEKAGSKLSKLRKKYNAEMQLGFKCSALEPKRHLFSPRLFTPTYKSGIPKRGYAGCFRIEDILVENDTTRSKYKAYVIFKIRKYLPHGQC